MKKLELVFENEIGKTVTYSLDDPIEPVDEAAVATAMSTIIDENVFESSGGALIKTKLARIVDRQVTEIELN